MSQAITVGLTIFGGVCVFVIGQIVTKFFLEPLYEQRKIFGEIAEGVLYYAQYFCNPGEDDVGGCRSKGADETRKLCTRLLARTSAIPFYKLFVCLKLVPKSEDVVSASEKLMGISNSFFRGEASRNDNAAQEIKTLLKISSWWPNNHSTGPDELL